MDLYLPSSKAHDNSKVRSSSNKACNSKTRSSSAKLIPLLLHHCNSKPTSRLQIHLLPPRNWQNCSTNSSAKLSLATPCLLPDNHRHPSHQLQLMSHCPWFSLKPNFIPMFNRDNHSKANQ